jgi:hypothetical protein
MAFKACLAVPCARAFTALFQFKFIASDPQLSLSIFLFRVSRSAPGHALSYYGGIAAATAIFGAWELCCILRYFSSRNKAS